MAYKIEIWPAAKRQIKSLDRQSQEPIVRRIKKLGATPRPSGREPVKGLPDFWRVRVGDYRIVYTVEDSERIVFVAKVGHRSEVYKRFDGLKNLLNKQRSE